MFEDAYGHARKYDLKQQYSRKNVGFGMRLQPSLTLAPFEKWGIDYMSQVHPASSRQMSYIILATEYLTKWTKAKAVKKDDVKTTAMFV